MTPRFLAEADEEFREAARYYEARAPGLGFAFIAETHRCARLLASNPGMGSWASAEQGLRKFGLRRFPYKLIYIDEGGDLIIVAVAHHRRRPFYWASRVTTPTT